MAGMLPLLVPCWPAAPAQALATGLTRPPRRRTARPLHLQHVDCSHARSPDRLTLGRTPTPARHHGRAARPRHGCPWDASRTSPPSHPTRSRKPTRSPTPSPRQRLCRAARRTGRSAVPGRLPRPHGRGGRPLRLRRRRRHIADKMVRRHPHVFGETRRARAAAPADALGGAETSASAPARAETGTLAGVPRPPRPDPRRKLTAPRRPGRLRLARRRRRARQARRGNRPSCAPNSPTPTRRG